MTLPVHNVVQLSDDDVVARFVVRGIEFEELLSHLHEPAPPRHALVVGPRGMGKSLLLRRVAVAIARDPGLSSMWLPLSMAEELYQVTSVGELWLAALARLAETLGDPTLVEQRDALLSERDRRRLEMLALQRVLTAVRARGQRLLLLVENLDMLLGDQVSSDQGWALREALQTEPDLLLIASAVATFDQMESQGEAFYGFFHRIDLRPLDDAEVRVLWREVTGIELSGDRAVPIRILTGGNPRLITVLGRFASHPDVHSLRDDLELLIDEYTPFFKANIEALPAVERKVFITLADIWAPATSAEVAERARMSPSQVSSLLGRLVGRGAVTIAKEGRKRRYEVTERLYNLYHLMRKPDGDGRVRALVDILVHLYDTEELERDIWPALARGQDSLDHAIAGALFRHFVVTELWTKLTPEELADRGKSWKTVLEARRQVLGDGAGEVLALRSLHALADAVTGQLAEAVERLREVAADADEALGTDNALSVYTRLVSDSIAVVAQLPSVDPVTTILSRAEAALDGEALESIRGLLGVAALVESARTGGALPRELRELAESARGKAGR